MGLDRHDGASAIVAPERVSGVLMTHETKRKTSHLGMLVRVKNVLTPEQQANLRAIRGMAHPAGGRSLIGTDAGTPRSAGAEDGGNIRER